MKERKKIIVFEDDPDTLDILKIILENEGFEIPSSGPRPDLCAVRLHQPHLVLLDHHLSSGLSDDFCRELKNHPETQHIPVLLVSADNNIKLVAAKCNADDFIAKPFDIEFLVERVRSYLHSA